MNPSPLEDWLTQPEGLATRLRDLRRAGGLSAKDFAQNLGWQPSKVSRLENGKQMPTPADIETWTRACGAEPTVERALLQLLDETQTSHRDFKRRMRRGQAVVQASYNELVQQSTRIRYFETVWIPGFLQTAEYAHRVFSEMIVLHGLDVEDVDAAVATRMQRQQLLYEPGRQFEFLLAEPVLRWLLCPPAAMRGQLDRLQTVIGMPNVRFGILPMGQPLTITPQNAFQIYDDITIVETFIGETIHRGGEAARYTQVMDKLWTEATTGEDARRLIVQAAQSLDLPSEDSSA